ncbi:hypothetical protein [Nocardioides aquiterrae]|uniref:Sensor domain-containing protein n=1 Tax=Nocardioides aquiterrae TaxID=203799 RepID=A0ABP4FC25_9ACTN
MHRRWLTRALIALAVPALTVPAAASSATAAAYPDVPSVDAVAKIYDHLDGGTASESTSKVYGPGKNCKPGKAIKGAGARSASYSPDYTSGDPDVYVIDGEHPMVSVTAMRFPNAKAAITYLHGSDKSAKDCGGGGTGGGGGGGGSHCDSKMTKIKFALGDERWGYQFRSTCRSGGQTSSSVFNTLFVRKGQFVVYATAMSMDETAPSIPKSIDLTELALKSV